MKTAIAILLLIGLLGTPIGCMASCPQLHHDCCSKASSTTICPLDILSAAKAALPAVAPVRVVPVVVTLVSVAPHWYAARPFDAGDLHLFNRVLRI